MKAIQKMTAGRGGIAVNDVPEPVPADDEVKIKVAYAGICGTDLAIYNGQKPVPTPIIMGHEAAGVIVETGSAVKNWHVGERVIFETTKYSDETCDFCNTGRHSLCKDRKALGQQVDGVFAEYFTQREKFLHHLPDDVSLEEAALVEPAACAYHSVFDCNDIKPIDHCLVIGPGPMGLFVTQYLKALGAYVCIAGVNGDEERLELASSFGAEDTANTMTEKIEDIKARNTKDGDGFDYVFECSGFESAIQLSYEAVKTAGTIVQVGTPSLKGVTIPQYNQIMTRELTVKGTVSQRYLNWDRVVELVERGILKMKPMISHIFDLDQAREAFDAKGKIKVVFRIHPELDKEGSQ